MAWYPINNPLKNGWSPCCRHFASEVGSLFGGASRKTACLLVSPKRSILNSACCRNAQVIAWADQWRFTWALWGGYQRWLISWDVTNLRSPSACPKQAVRSIRQKKEGRCFFADRSAMKIINFKDFPCILKWVAAQGRTHWRSPRSSKCYKICLQMLPSSKGTHSYGTLTVIYCNKMI